MDDKIVGELWRTFCIPDEFPNRGGEKWGNLHSSCHVRLESLIRKLVEERAMGYGSAVLATNDPLYQIAIGAALHDFGIDPKEWK